jgi:transposase
MERRQFTREFKLEAVRLIKERGISYAQASEDLGVHPTQLRNRVKQLAADPEQAFPGHGQMKPEQLEIAQLKRDVPVTRRGQGRRVRLHRTLLQSKTPALDDRLFKPYGVRAAGGINLSGCQPNRVQLNV